MSECFLSLSMLEYFLSYDSLSFPHLSCRLYTSSSHNNIMLEPDYDFENAIFAIEDDEESEVSAELVRMLENEGSKIEPSQEEELETINLGAPDKPQEVKVSTSLSQEERTALIKLLKEYKDVFAWSYEDMPGLDRSIVEHSIPTKLD